jgi:hypothetical protein
MDEMQVVVESVIKEPFWAGAIAAGALTEDEAKLLIPVVLVTPEGQDTPQYLQSLIAPLQRMLDYDNKSVEERANG